jgi:protein-L-isoaspartate(D-aspartate) O-methyltransferase
LTQVVNGAEAERAQQLRSALVSKLRAEGVTTSQAIADAFMNVPRHVFVPTDTSPEDAYDANLAPRTKQDAHGVTISSVSAPWLQAVMLQQAQVAPGMRCLEIGSTGYNAALLAEIVGREGHVVSVDIDPEVTDRASALLDATGYGGRVTVMQADAEHGVPGAGQFDAILVTVGAWDIPPAWLEQLTPNGVLVVPLVMAGITRSIAFHRKADHLVSSSAEVCGFVPMQGEGRHPEQAVLLADPHGRHVKLRFDDDPPEPHPPNGVLGTETVEVWSDVTIGHGISFADMYLWFGCFLPGFCKINADEGTGLDKQRKSKGMFPVGVVRGGSLAYLATRPAVGSDGVEFGARAYGEDGQQTAATLVEQVQAWNQHARDREAPTFSYWPNRSDHTQLPAGAAILKKAHGLVAVQWPTTVPALDTDLPPGEGSSPVT